jgi:Na+-translocating ferredoxin:NAD+ oxidoreductase RnfG subunit
MKEDTQVNTLVWRRNFLLGLIAFLASIALVVVSHAFTLMTKEQALKDMFGDAEVKMETVRLRGKTLKTVLDKLGGQLVYEQKGSESAPVAAHKKIDFYVASRNGKPLGVAIIDVQPGRWGPVEFIIGMDFQGRVRKVRVMSYQEKRGRPIARRSFMGQYVGKTLNSTLTVGRDITGISGATISSRAATFSVKKALVLLDEVYLKDKK